MKLFAGLARTGTGFCRTLGLKTERSLTRRQVTEELVEFVVDDSPPVRDEARITGSTWTTDRRGRLRQKKGSFSTTDR
jgi:hypothetical protein